VNSNPNSKEASSRYKLSIEEAQQLQNNLKLSLAKAELKKQILEDKLVEAEEKYRGSLSIDLQNAYTTTITPTTSATTTTTITTSTTTTTTITTTTTATTTTTITTPESHLNLIAATTNLEEQEKIIERNQTELLCASMREKFLRIRLKAGSATLPTQPSPKMQQKPIRMKLIVKTDST